MVSTVIEVTNLKKSYHRKKVLSEINLKIPKGSIFGLIGKNGAGKTTLLRCILGLQNPTEGKIIILDRETSVNSRPDYNKITGIIEEPALFHNLTALENIEVFHKLTPKTTLPVLDVLESVGLEIDNKVIVRHYSQGMKQRLAIGIALMTSPEILILDEPINGLDPSGIRDMSQMISDIPKQFGTTVILSSHILSELEKIISHFAILSGGVIAYSSSLLEVQKHYVTIDLHEGALHKVKSVQKKDASIINIPSKSDSKSSSIIHREILEEASISIEHSRPTSLEDIYFAFGDE